ncbi:MAG TPA: 4,5-DOPA dioxygenase extradiol [Bacteroidales bacterium]|nr:4,5-DOPA dioxygenase extradiol [Bacteroidales bacterium]
MNDIYNLSQNLNSTERMPVLFLGHGTPMNAIEENEFVRGFRNIGKSIPRPVAVLCISAHWETKGTYVTGMENPPTIHDFGGFPEELFQVQYPAPGNPSLANELQQTIKKGEICIDFNWGLDHGAWSVIRHLYPEAEIPVIQMSLDYRQTPLYHYELGSELAVLREKGILIIGSGNMIHNLRLVAWDKLNTDNFGYDWALEAGDKMKNFIREGDHKSLINFNKLGRSFDLSIPTPEHYLPLLYVLSLSQQNERVEFFNDKTVAGSLLMTSVKIG